MAFMHSVVSAIRALFHKERVEKEMDEELKGYLDTAAKEKMRTGMNEEQARRAARVEMGSVEAVKEEIRSAGWESILETLWQDLRYGARVIRRSPLFALSAVLCLSVGIGANTTVFTIINTLLLHPLPAANTSRLVVLYDSPTHRSGQQWSQPALSYANLQDYMGQQQCFQRVAAFTWPQILTFARANGPERMFGELVTKNYFDTLGLKPALGRFFLPSEVTEPGSAPVAVLSYSAWQARFGGARDILGRTLELNHVAFAVVGVAPEGFLGLSAVFGPDVWLPATMAEQVFPAEFRSALSDRAKPLFRGIGKLRDGFSIERAQANLDTLAASLAREYPESNEGHGIQVRPVTDELFFGAGGTSGLTLASAVLLTVVLLVLGIACSNVANLLLARAASRQHEIGLRLAIGASRGRLIRQMLTESALLSLVSCACGIALGYTGCRLVWSFVPTQYLHNMVAPKFDGAVLVFAVLVSLLTTFLFGLVPALRASRTNVVAALKDETAAGRGLRALRFTRALVVGQVAFSLLCLITAALFFHSIERAYIINPGFQTDHLALVMMNPTQSGYDAPRAKEFYRLARKHVQSLPGVASVSWASGMPFWNSASRSVVLEGAEPMKKSESLRTVSIIAGLDYFRTMDIPRVAGRVFNEGDRENSLPVAIINQALAAQHWPGGNALGHRFRFTDDNTWREVVGIVKNANYSKLGEAPQLCVYLPQRQNFAGGMTLYVRSLGNPAALLPSIQREVRTLDNNVEVSDARTGTMLIEQVLWGPKVGVALLGVFASLALILASIGLYGVMAFSVSRRMREIGLRMALGASRGSVQRLVVAQGMKLVGWGIALGLAASLLLGRALSSMLFGISSADPASLVLASLTLVTVALTACYIPARSATRMDPMMALREG